MGRGSLDRYRRKADCNRGCNRDCSLGSSVDIDNPDRLVAVLEQSLLRVNDQFSPRQPDGQDLVRNVAVIYGQNPDAYESGPHLARVSVFVRETAMAMLP